jgi:hypothetical protein
MEINQWLKLVEYGDHPHLEGVQRVTKEAALEMQRKFRSLRARLARKFGGIPIYIGHPDDQNFSRFPGHNDTRSYAWVQDIEARDDGIWILPKWSEVGKTMIENSFFKFLSPRWEMKQENDVLIPIRLISVGLTNHPNIPGDTIANQEIIEHETNTPKETIPADHEVIRKIPTKRSRPKKKVSKDNNTQPNTDLSKSPLLEQVDHLLMRLFAVNFSQTFDEIEKTLTSVAKQAHSWREEGKNLKTIHQELLSESEGFYKIACAKEQQVQELTEELKNEKNRSGEHFVNFAINRGLILPSESTKWKEKYIADPHTASNELLQQTCTLNTTSKTENLRNVNVSHKEHILALVNKRMDTKEENYTEAWKAVKKLYPSLF